MAANYDVIASAAAGAHREMQEQVDRILRSEGFRSSEILRNLLAFLCACAMEERHDPVKVREIATAVFGRSETFDAQTDSVVRVHTGRLRSKLAEYYMGEGSEDDLIVTIPKGTYALVAHGRQSGGNVVASQQAAAAAARPVEAPPRINEANSSRSIRLRTAVLVVAAAVAVSAVTTALVARRWTEAPRTPALRALWAPFTMGETPLIVFSNFEFVGTMETGLKAYAGGGEPATPLIDTYTSMGEVMGVFEVSRLLTSWRTPLRTKRGRLLTWDEARDTDLIFVGGPLAQTPLRNVPVLEELQFQGASMAAPQHPGAVVNVHPRGGELPIYYCSEALYQASQRRNSSFDYAVIALRPALSPNHHILVLAGITEFGTEAAAEFVTRENQVSELVARLNRKPDGGLPWFEALLRVQIEGGVPVQSRIILVHQSR